jgi:hypothetical protein
MAMQQEGWSALGDDSGLGVHEWGSWPDLQVHSTVVLGIIQARYWNVVTLPVSSGVLGLASFCYEPGIGKAEEGL